MDSTTILTPNGEVYVFTIIGEKSHTDNTFARSPDDIQLDRPRKLHECQRQRRHHKTNTNSTIAANNQTCESSLFVSKRRWILKTCGTTTLLNCLQPLLDITQQYGFSEICDLFYSRKNFVRPELQIFPHRGFCEEVKVLDSMFEDGRSYCLGSINRECWFLYTFSRNVHLPNIQSTKPKVSSEPDQTIEILMQNLDPDIMSKFSKAHSATAQEVTLKTGINKILPEMTIDDFLFDPCGYSMNGIGKQGDYMTIHITPENKFSYVSFESNVSLGNYTSLINRVTNTFKPKKFIITIFANKASAAYTTVKELELEYAKTSNWHRNDMQCCSFPSYNLLYAQYVQEP